MRAHVLLTSALIVACSNDAQRVPTPTTEDAGVDQPEDDSTDEPRIIELDLEKYNDAPCARDSDCALVIGRWACDCGGCRSSPVLAEHAAAAAAELEAAKAECAEEECAGIFECFDDQQSAVCDDGVCGVVHGALCGVEGRTCFDYEAEYTFPELVQCIDYRCYECVGTGAFEPGGCPDGYQCIGVFCHELEACDDPIRCRDQFGGGYTGCNAGYCRRCGDDTHCRPDWTCLNGACLPP